MRPCWHIEANRRTSDARSPCSSNYPVGPTHCALAGSAAWRLAAPGAPPQVVIASGERVGGVGPDAVELIRRQPHAPSPCTWSLSAPAAAGHRRLDLARSVQRDRQGCAARRRRLPPPSACAVPITVRSIGWLNTRSTATVSGRVLGQPPRSASRSRSNRAVDVPLVGVGGPTPTGDQGGAGGPDARPPRRARTWSGRGRCRKPRLGVGAYYWVTRSTRSSPRALVRQRRTSARRKPYRVISAGIPQKALVSAGRRRGFAGPTLPRRPALPTSSTCLGGLRPAEPRATPRDAGAQDHAWAHHRQPVEEGR